MAILAIVPGKPNMCLQENLADCVDCGGLFGGGVQTKLQNLRWVGEGPDGIGQSMSIGVAGAAIQAVDWQ